MPECVNREELLADLQEDIADRPDTIICSECNAGFDVWKHEQKNFHFCPNCGAKVDAQEV